MTGARPLTWRQARPALIGLGVGAAAGAGAGVAVVGGYSAQLQGLLGAGALLAVAAGLVRTARRVQGPERAEEARQVEGYLGYPCMCADPGRRRLLRCGAVGAGVLAVAGAAVPMWSATRRAEERLRRTAWRGGTRLVGSDNRPLSVDALPVGAVTTVWPEGATEDADAQTVLIRLRPGREITGPGRTDWTAAGHVAYSKLCTHMGCPVGLYQQRADVLVCPCHQAVFDILRGAEPVSGPAHRPLPQLPLAVDGDGFLIATDDFPHPVGPGFWSRPS